MINGVFDVTTAQYAAIKATLVDSTDAFIVEANGALITDPISFYLVIGTALGAPRDDMAEVSQPGLVLRRADHVLLVRRCPGPTTLSAVCSGDHSSRLHHRGWRVGLAQTAPRRCRLLG